MADINIDIIQEGTIQATVALPNSINVSVTIPATPNIEIFQTAVIAGGAIKPPVVYDALTDNDSVINVTGDLTAATIAIWQSTTPLKEVTALGTIPGYCFRRTSNTIELGTPLSLGERLFIITDKTLSVS